METGQREIAVTEPEPSQARGYDTFYERFDAPLMQRLRQEAYGQDIGQHSWVTVEELAQDIVRLQTVVALSERGAVARTMYLAERKA